MATATKQPGKKPVKQSATVRISEQSHAKLRDLAAQSGEPMQMVLDQALEQYRRQKFWAECDAAYAALQQDADAWKEYQDELKLWEVTLMDGLDPTEDWSYLSEGDPAGQNIREEKFG